MQKQPPEMFYKKAIVNNLAIFKGKHLCWSLLLTQNIAKFLTAPTLKNICQRLLLNMFIRLRKTKNCSEEILTLVKMFVFIS